MWIQFHNVPYTSLTGCKIHLISLMLSVLFLLWNLHLAVIQQTGTACDGIWIANKVET